TTLFRSMLLLMPFTRLSKAPASAARHLSRHLRVEQRTVSTKVHSGAAGKSSIPLFGGRASSRSSAFLPVCPLLECCSRANYFEWRNVACNFPCPDTSSDVLLTWR